MSWAGQRLALAGWVCLATACPRTPAGPPPDDGAGDPAAPTEAAARERPGQELVATIPLADGTALELESLRGRPVILALASPSGPQALALAQLVSKAAAPHGTDPVVVLVASGEPTAFDALAETDDGERVFAYDPQGALATRLQVRALPTVFVVGRTGLVVDVWAGEIDAEAVSGAVEKALAAP